jgi:hypothetical protein
MRAAAARAIVEVFVAFLLLAVVVTLAIPALQAWQLANCAGEVSLACDVGGKVLMYWWLAVLPVLAIVALQRGHAAVRRNARGAAR